MRSSRSIKCEVWRSSNLRCSSLESLTSALILTTHPVRASCSYYIMLSCVYNKTLTYVVHLCNYRIRSLLGNPLYRITTTYSLQSRWSGRICNTDRFFSAFVRLVDLIFIYRNAAFEHDIYPGFGAMHLCIRYGGDVGLNISFTWATSEPHVETNLRSYSLPTLID